MKKALSPEVKVKKYFASNGVFLTKIPQKGIPTPDFKGDNVLVEVKKIEPQEIVEWIDEKSSQNQNEKENKDSTFNTIKNNLKTAAKQLKSYNQKHKKRHIVVIFFDEHEGNIDISAVLGKNYPPNISNAYLSSGMQLSHKHKKYIDAIVHFRKISDPKPKFVWDLSNDGRGFWKKYFPTI